MTIDVSICIPVFNERLALRQCILEMKSVMDQLPFRYEFVIVDDGSTDNCISQVADLDIRVIQHRRRFGGGVARVTAMRYARGTTVLQTDADGTYPCDAVPEILSRLRTADLVIGARKQESARDWRWLRVLMKWSIKTVAAVLAGAQIPDLNSGMRAYDRRLALRYAHLYPKGHSIMSTMTLAFITEGLRVDYVPIEYRERQGKSTFHPIIDTYNYVVTIIRTIVNFDPLRILLPVSAVSCASGIAFAIRTFARTRSIGSFPAVLLPSSLVILIIAILADQVAKLSRQIAGLTNEKLVEEADAVEIDLTSIK